MKFNKFTIIACVITALIFGALGFFGGMHYPQSKLQGIIGNSSNDETKQRVGRMMDGSGTNRKQLGNQKMGGSSFKPVAGQIISLDDKSITVKLVDGSSKIVLYTTTTSVNKTTAGALSDLKVGEEVRVFGTVNLDGSVTAEDVQLGIFRNDPAVQDTTK